VNEAAIRRDAEVSGEEATRQMVRLRAEERQAVLAALARTNQLYKEVVLVQSDAAVQSTLGQYKVGKVTFASVLDVLRGRIADDAGYLDSLAQARRVAIAQREVSLDPPPSLGGAVTSGGMPGTGASGGGGGGGSKAPNGGAQEQGPASQSGGGMPSGM
jgi:hypothetical protein